ncbi:hypothetical protein C8R45DRAFT_935765 [Mycena sanguinolenta]|nr:hypothetical protein C8R45DRAFT_935765 [Mycena sanguinolenta]
MNLCKVKIIPSREGSAPQQVKAREYPHVFERCTAAAFSNSEYLVDRSEDSRDWAENKLDTVADCGGTARVSQLACFDLSWALDSSRLSDGFQRVDAQRLEKVRDKETSTSTNYRNRKSPLSSQKQFKQDLKAKRQKLDVKTYIAVCHSSDQSSVATIPPSTPAASVIPTTAAPCIPAAAPVFVFPPLPPLPLPLTALPLTPAAPWTKRVTFPMRGLVALPEKSHEAMAGEALALVEDQIERREVKARRAGRGMEGKEAGEEREGKGAIRNEGKEGRGWARRGGGEYEYRRKGNRCDRGGEGRAESNQKGRVSKHNIDEKKKTTHPDMTRRRRTCGKDHHAELVPGGGAVEAAGPGVSHSRGDEHIDLGPGVDAGFAVLGVDFGTGIEVSGAMGRGMKSRKEKKDSRCARCLPSRRAKAHVRRRICTILEDPTHPPPAPASLVRDPTLLDLGAGAGARPPETRTRLSTARRGAPLHSVLEPTPPVVHAPLRRRPQEHEHTARPRYHRSVSSSETKRERRATAHDAVRTARTRRDASSTHRRPPLPRKVATPWGHAELLPPHSIHIHPLLPIPTRTAQGGHGEGEIRNKTEQAVDREQESNPENSKRHAQGRHFSTRYCTSRTARHRTIRCELVSTRFFPRENERGKSARLSSKRVGGWTRETTLTRLGAAAPQDAQRANEAASSVRVMPGPRARMKGRPPSPPTWITAEVLRDASRKAEMASVSA